MRPKWMKTFKFVIMFALMGIITLLRGHIRVSIALFAIAFITFLITAFIWLIWLLHLGK